MCTCRTLARRLQNIIFIHPIYSRRVYAISRVPVAVDKKTKLRSLKCIHDTRVYKYIFINILVRRGTCGRSERLQGDHGRGVFFFLTSKISTEVIFGVVILYVCYDYNTFWNYTLSDK